MGRSSSVTKNNSARARSLRGAGAVCLALLLVVPGGCAGSKKRAKEPATRTLGSLNSHEANASISDAVFNQQTANGAIMGRSVYPYHFHTDGATLNTLGTERVAMLAAEYQRYGEERPLRLNVVRSDASEALYEARLNTLRATLEFEGLPSDRVTFVDETPGGRGMSTEQVLQAEQRGGSRDASMTNGDAPREPRQTGGTGSGTGGGRPSQSGSQNNRGR